MLLDTNILKEAAKTENLSHQIYELAQTEKSLQSKLNQKLSTLSSVNLPTSNLDFNLSLSISDFHLNYSKTHNEISMLDKKLCFLESLQKEASLVFNAVDKLSVECLYFKGLALREFPITKFCLYDFSHDLRMMIHNQLISYLNDLRKMTDEWVGIYLRVGRELGHVLAEYICDPKIPENVRNFSDLLRYIRSDGSLREISEGYSADEQLNNLHLSQGSEPSIDSNHQDMLPDEFGGIVAGPVKDEPNHPYNNPEMVEETLRKSKHGSVMVEKSSHKSNIYQDKTQGTFQKPYSRQYKNESLPYKTDMVTTLNSKMATNTSASLRNITVKTLPLSQRIKIRQDLQLPKILTPYYLHTMLNSEFINKLNNKRQSILQTANLTTLIGLLHIETILSEKSPTFNINISREDLSLTDSIKLLSALKYFRFKRDDMEGICAKKSYDFILDIKNDIQSFDDVLKFAVECLKLPLIQTVTEFWCSIVDSSIVNYYEKDLFGEALCALESIITELSFFEDSLDLFSLNYFDNVPNTRNISESRRNTTSLDGEKYNQDFGTIKSRNETGQQDQPSQEYRLEKTKYDQASASQMQENIMDNQNKRFVNESFSKEASKFPNKKFKQYYESILQTDFRLSKLLRKEIQDQKILITEIFQSNNLKRLQTDVIIHPIVIIEIYECFERDLQKLEAELVAFYVFLRAKDLGISRILDPLIDMAKRR